MNKTFALCLFLFSLKVSSSTKSYDEFLKENKLHSDNFKSSCIIYNLQGKVVRNYDGQQCAFEDDGSYIISQNDGVLSYKDKFNKVVWSKPQVFAHHMIGRNSEGNYLILSNEYKKELGEVVRYDVASIISRADGRTLKRFSFIQNFAKISGKEKLSKDMLWKLNFKFENPDATYECTHANSIYQIENLQNKKVPYDNGDYVVNTQGAFNKIIVLDKKTFAPKLIFNPGPIFIHDVQVDPNGNFIFYNNTPGSEDMNESEINTARSNPSGKSIINTYDIRTHKLSTYFKKNEAKYLMHYTGSIQMFNDGTILTVDDTNNKSSILFINRDGVIIKKIPMPHSGKIVLPRIKLIDMKMFLTNNIGL